MALISPKGTPEELAAVRQTIALLLQHGAAFPEIGDDKTQALLKAAALGELKTMQALVQQGASVMAIEAAPAAPRTPN
jgi:hypothetical protein